MHSGADKVQNTRFKIGKYGVSDTYKDKLEKKKSVLDNRLAYLDKTDPEKALRAREALRTQGNTVGDIKNIGKIMKDDPNYLAEVNNNKAALDTKARNISNAAPDKVDGDGDIQKQRDEAAVKIRALREKRSDAGYGLDTGYNPSNNSLNNELNNNQNNQSQSTQPNRGPLTSQEEVFNRGPKTNTERVFNDGEILNNNQNNQSQSTQPNTTNNNLYPGEPITQAEIIERTNKNTGKAGFLHTPEERLTAREQLINERLNQNSQ
ncbi:MAG: hypothetical protein ORN26_00100 [Candidatus Pacebacteria bacterium]|nr:hypothetical protein [Candidatus Paceibacterota bacterium]